MKRSVLKPEVKEAREQKKSAFINKQFKKIESKEGRPLNDQEKEVIQKNIEIAFNFYLDNMIWIEEEKRIDAVIPHLWGIDFTQPISAKILKEGMIFGQRQPINEWQGSYYTYINDNVSPQEVGINPKGTSNVMSHKQWEKEIEFLFNSFGKEQTLHAKIEREEYWREGRKDDAQESKKEKITERIILQNSDIQIDTEKVMNFYHVKKDKETEACPQGLCSTAASIEDSWSIHKHNPDKRKHNDNEIPSYHAEGGGRQYFIPRRDLMERVSIRTLKQDKDEKTVSCCSCRFFKALTTKMKDRAKKDSKIETPSISPR